MPDTSDPTQFGFRGRQACTIAGVTYRQLDYWARTGLIEPSVESANGSGTTRLYSYEDLIYLKLIKKMLDGGLVLQKVRKAISYLRDQLGVDLASASLVIDSNAVLLLRSDGELEDVLRSGQGVFNVVPVGNTKLEVDETIELLVADGQLAQSKDVARSSDVASDVI